MVSTRGHPRQFPEPDLSPSKSTPSKSTSSPRSRGRKSTGRWAHTPSNLTLLWLFFSLPLVIWDIGYVLLRPMSMPGGSLHWPLWVPYDLYGRVDHIYGWKAFNAHNGFTAAQATLNVIETLFYFYYLYLVYAFGHQSKAAGRGAPKPSTIGFLGEQRSVGGQYGAIAVVVGFSAAVMTVSKTLLYGLNEAYSGFDNIGHNKAIDILFLWIIPNGAWLAVPSYMTYVFGSEILQGLSISAGVAIPSSDDTSLVKVE